MHTTPSLRLDTSEEWDDTDCQMVSRRVIPFFRDGEIDRGAGEHAILTPSPTGAGATSPQSSNWPKDPTIPEGTQERHL